MTKLIDPKEPIAVIGIGCIFPGAQNTSQYWKNILGKVDSITEVPKDRWDWKLFYSEDRSAPDKTYSKIGGFVRGFKFDPLPLRIPPLIARQMDTVQQLAVATTAEALKDSGYDKKPFDRERTAVIFGNAMGGPKKEASDLRIYTSIYLDKLASSPSFKKLPKSTQKAISAEAESSVKADLMEITEDSMPGELSNVIAGRVANTFNVNGPNFTVDAACAASLGAVAQAVNGLRFRQFDMVVTGGVDQMMEPPAYVKFCKIGALSPDGSRPFDAGANGFVMGEGAGTVILKRLSDAVTDGDKIYALIHGIGASSDGRGKGITAPNPKGQKLAMQRAFETVDYGPEDVELLEAHGTATAVGDLVELQAGQEIFAQARNGSVTIGSIKSQIGHLKAAAGAASLIKTVLALHHKTLPPSINFKVPNPGIDWKNSPFTVNTEPREWKTDRIRRANVSAFGFGGTNFHVVLEEATPETTKWTPKLSASETAKLEDMRPPKPLPPALGGESFILRGKDAGSIFNRLETLKENIPASGPLTRTASKYRDDRGGHILTIAAESTEKLKAKIDFTLKMRDQGEGLWDQPPIQFKPKSIFLGRTKGSASEAPKIAFLFPGQGSQYVDMLKDLAGKYQVVRETFEEADRIMTSLIGEPLTAILWTKGGETPEELKAKQERIKQTEITQPAVLTADVALLRLLRQLGVEPDIVAGHSLGEYGALVAAGVLSFENALDAVSARGREMANTQVSDNGKMASVAAPVSKIEPILKEIDGYVICANKNCPIQTVIAGESSAVEEAVKRFGKEGIQSQLIEVSHAFHSKIVAPATVPYAKFLERVQPKRPRIPVSSNVTAEYYPNDEAKVRKLMAKQISSPVEWIRQIERMYKDGVRIFVEVGPKRALTAFATSTIGEKQGVVVASSNHPKRGGIHEFNDLLARLTAAGIEIDLGKLDLNSKDNIYNREYLDWALSAGAPATSAAAAVVTPTPAATSAGKMPQDMRELLDRWNINLGPIVVSGIGAGAPGTWDKLFREHALDDIIDGKNLIEPVSEEKRRRMLDKNLDRVVKSKTGNHRIKRLESIEEVIRLAGQAGEFDISKEFGIRGSISSLMDRTAQMGLAAGLIALRDAGLPLVRRYKKTTTGSMIPTHWALPEEIGEETGVIMASAFPGIDSLIDDLSRYFADKYSHRPAQAAWEIYDRMIQKISDPDDRKALADWYAEQRRKYPATGGKDKTYKFSRSFLFRILSLGHAQTAQFIGAKGPCTQINAACASTTQAVGIAEDWIRLGRAKRVLIISADDVTNPTLFDWISTGFLASGASSTSNVVSEAALPFDRRRNGMLIGMGASALVVEDGREPARRGVTPLAELLATQFDNSAFHVTRLNLQHVCETMEKLISKVERRYGLSRKEIAPKMLFMSHETYTPAQGGSSQAEVEALKYTFKEDTTKVIVTNTKGFTGHAMGASLEDVIAVRAMNVGKLPPIANYKEADPELAGITLSKGGDYDCEYALRLGAGFGSQIAMTLLRRIHKVPAPRIDEPVYKSWLAAASGIPNAETEIVHNTLRVVDPGRKVIAGLTPLPTTKPVPAPRPAPVPAAAVPAAAAAAPAAATPSPAPAAATPAPAPAANASPAPAPSGTPAVDGVTAEIVALVSEKTGYPADMLELDLDMEADLGIDTVKQAELIGIIREKYSIPSDDNLSLKDYPTLRHVVGFVMNSGSKTAETPATPQPAAAAPATPAPAPAAATPAPAPAAATPAPVAPAPAPSGTPAVDGVTAEIVALVSEKTGYPADMLELDLDMEADLGIDTVKQAELIGIIREKYSIPSDDNLSLKDYPTLRHVVGFVMNSGSKTAETPATPQPAEKEAAPAANKTGKSTDAAPQQNSRFAAWNLEAYERPAVTKAPKLKKGRAVVILAADLKTAEPFEKAVVKLGGDPVVVKTADWGTAEKTTEVLRKALGKKKAGAIIDVTCLDLDDFEKLTSTGFDRNYRKSTRALFLSAQALYQDLQDAGQEAWIVVLTQMGGTHACKALKPFQPMAGAQTGLAKNLSREFADATVRIVDFDDEATPTSMAKAALAELGSDDPRREVGYRKGKRHALRLVRTGEFSRHPFKLTNLSVVLITGGSGALGTTIGKEIAKRHKSTIILMDLAPLPKEATVWARMSDAELKAFKMEMWAEMKAESKKDKTKRATPAILERKFGTVTRAVFLHRSMEEIIRHGGKAHYVAADLTDGPSVTKAVRQALRSRGRIDFVLHAGGLEESKLIPDKKVERFDRVFRPKALGAFHLVKAVPVVRGQRWAFFSSVASRFGNLGQADYSSSCDMLSKLASYLNTTDRSAVDYALTAFGEIGMATRGGIAQFLKSMGVDFMPPGIGIPLMLDQLTGNDETHETLIAGALGQLDFERIIQDPSPPSPLGSMPQDGTLLDKLVSNNGSGTVTSKTFSLESDPWLRDHSIEGTPWVSGVMGLELFAETLGKLTGEVPAALDDIRFGLPIKLLRNKPITVRITAKESPEGTTLTIESDFISPQGKKLGDTRTHFTARTTTGDFGWGNVAKPALPGKKWVVDAKRIYQNYFHGPSYQVLAGIDRISEGELLAVYRRPSKPLWEGKGRELVFQPLLIEAAFQACGYRDLHFSKKMTLPDSIGRVRVFRTETPPEELYVLVRYKGTETRKQESGASRGSKGEIRSPAVPGDRSLYDAFVFDKNYGLWAAIQDYRMIAVS